jgi:BirA family biotin operon repressor/biotin-[acetyl-CoA-carboxylase] ligase
VQPSDRDRVFSLSRFQELLSTSWLGRDCRYEAVVGSTMDVARASIGGAGGQQGTVIVAGEQTAGRGRFGRRWHTPAGGSLALSLILQPHLLQLKALSMMAPLAVVEGLDRACGLATRIKWPNDIEAGGRKLAGILIDSEIAGDAPGFTIVGIGINVSNDTSAEPEIATVATSVLAQTGRRFEREMVLAECLQAFERIHEQPVPATFNAWRAALSTLGCRIQLRAGERVHTGVAEDVSSNGSLLLRTDEGTLLAFAAGEVTLRA